MVATAPVRVADVGGWTDTWFASTGAVCNVAVGPGARVEVRPRDDDRVTIAAPQVTSTDLLRRAVSATGATGVDVVAGTAVPPGSSLGTSASVLVALLAALDVAIGRGQPGPVSDPDGLARRAWEVETVHAGRESGVQDQVAAAHGGVSAIVVDGFPHWRHRPVPPPSDLADRLRTVHLPGGRDSSDLHRRVIARAESGDGVVATVLERLAALARDAVDALDRGDLEAWGAALTGATEAQARLHPSLVPPAARAAGEAAVAAGALGWKVDGAGGTGGTVTVVTGPDPTPVETVLASAGTLLDLAPSRGAVVDRA